MYVKHRNGVSVYSVPAVCQLLHRVVYECLCTILTVLLLNGWQSPHFMDENQGLRQVKRSGRITPPVSGTVSMPSHNHLAAKLEHCTLLPVLLNKEANKPEICFLKNHEPVQKNKFKIII